MAADNEEATADAPAAIYPKITGKRADLLYKINQLLQSQDQGEPVPSGFPFIGTVKLHGAHADILVYQEEQGYRFTYQSRNRAITREDDNYGFAAFCAQRSDANQQLTEAIMTQESSLNSGKVCLLTPDQPLIMAGEWIGSGIQKGVAISQLSRRFVLFGIQIHGQWQQMAYYPTVAVEHAGLYNICCCGTFRGVLTLEDNGDAFMRAADAYMADVVAACPFGQKFGVDGEGEGIVWTPNMGSLLPNEPDFWLKTKGPEKSRDVSQAKLEQLAKSADTKARADELIQSMCTEERLQQGLQYLTEMGIAHDKKAIGKFIAWLQNDIEVEEAAEIEKLGLRGKLKASVASVARDWYLKNV